MYSINLRSLKTEMKHLKDATFWADSHYWTTRQPGVKRKKGNTGVRIAYLKKFNWYAFVFSKFHRESLAVFQELPTHDAYFYKEVMGSNGLTQSCSAVNKDLSAPTSKTNTRLSNFEQACARGYGSNFAAWCIDGKHFDDILRQLKEMPDIEKEFVVKDSGKGLELPEPFQAMGITFYKSGTAC